MLIHSAARAGDIDELRRLIAAGTPVNVRGFLGSTPLMLAARDRRVGPEVVQLLLAAGADPTLGDGLRSTPLHEAVISDNLEKVKLLVEAGVDVRTTNEAQNGVLPAWKGNRAIFDYLVEHGADCRQTMCAGLNLVGILYVTARFDDLKYVHGRGAPVEALGLSPVTRALLFGSREELELTLSLGPDLDARDSYWATPFLAALRSGNLWAAERLQGAGANIRATYGWGLLTKRETPNALYAAIESDDPTVIAWVLAKGFSLEECDEALGSPLFFAVRFNRVRAARALIEAGADVHKKVHPFGQPINCAETLEMVQLLSARGADINHVNGSEWPLAEFAFNRDAAAVRWLLAAGARLDITSSAESALHKAVFSDDAEIVKLLLNAGADVNALGSSVLSHVHSRRVLALLVEAGIDLRTAAEDEYGFPAWHRIHDPELAAEVEALAVNARAGRRVKPLPDARADT